MENFNLKFWDPKHDNCFICNNKITLNESFLVKVKNGKNELEDYVKENLKFICPNCKHQMKRREDIETFKKRMKIKIEPVEDLIKKEVDRRNSEIAENKNKIEKNNTKIEEYETRIKKLKDENRLIKMKIDQLSSVFCEKIINGRICGLSDCQHDVKNKNQELMKYDYRIENFMFEKFNDHSLIITQPSKFERFIVLATFPYRVLFRLTTLSSISFYDFDSDIETLIKIKGFELGNEYDLERFIEGYEMVKYDFYCQNAIIRLKNFLPYHSVVTIKRIFKKYAEQNETKHQAFTLAYHELKTILFENKTKRKVETFSICKPLDTEVRLLKL